MLKVCRGCQSELPVEDFTISDRARGYRKARCKRCENARVRVYYHTHETYRENRKEASRHQRKTPEQTRKHMLKHKYGLTESQFNAMLAAQDRGCALCGSSTVGNAQWERKFFYVDHDHATGRVRGLLCHKCNARLGSYEGLREEIGEDKLMRCLHPEPGFTRADGEAALVEFRLRYGA